MSKKFNVKLVSPEGVKYEDEADELILPTENGQIGVLADHEPLIALLSPGEIVVKTGTREHYLATHGGVVKIAGNVVEILADSATYADELDQVKINEAREKAVRQLAEAKDETDYATAAGMLEKILASEKVLKRRKRAH
jgi:F-type H+-transporting ATPase subunit epsilon